MVHQEASVLSSSVLVLNRGYLAVHAVSVRRAFVLLYREIAEVVHLENGQYANYDFAAWCHRPANAGDRPSYDRPGDRPASLRASGTLAGDDWMRSVNFRVRVPRVIRLLRFDRAARPLMRFSRRSLFARDQNRCQYCGKVVSGHHLSLDHVIPKSQGGDTSWENVVCCCVSCNTAKGGRTPREARMKLLRQPRRPRVNPLLTLRLNQPKYEIWKTFLPVN